ncbi:serine hydrolase [Modestobacter muralis]|uniref:Serine hydrolase n=1 Tax=Modestobacter muralis TaxID=1608614 RepID=A0A6P0H6L4_9ACTN|nr:serine hydrolase [Modestobacter muralis]
MVDAAGRTVLATAAADRPVYTASLVELLVVQQVLARQAVGVLGLGPADGGLLERAVTVSDDPAMNLLWDAYDGADLVATAAASFGLTGTAAPDRVGQWGESTTTATDLARFLATLAEDPDAPGAAPVLGWMRAAAPLASDGFDQRFGLLAGGAVPGTAVEQGWMCCVADRRQLHSAGVLPDGRVVVVLADASSTLLGRADADRRRGRGRGGGRHGLSRCRPTRSGRGRPRCPHGAHVRRGRLHRGRPVSARRG